MHSARSAAANWSALYHPDSPTAPLALPRLGFGAPMATTLYDKPAVAVRLTAAAAQGGRPLPRERRREPANPGSSGTV